jgi:hypothetical protein
MTALRMAAGATALAGAVIAFLLAFGGWLPWPAFFGFFAACVGVGTWLSIRR